MRLLCLLTCLAWAASVPAQTMYKCLDENRKLTYSNVPCAKQGLKDGGTVTADRVTTMPFTKPDKDAPLPTQKLKPPVEMPKDPEKNSK